MKFIINNIEWTIEELENKKLLEMYKEENEGKTYYTFGVTKYPTHIIYINKDMCISQKIRTLKHELTHCYIWSYGLYNITEITEEIVCDIVANSNDFINDVVKQYRNTIEVIEGGAND